MLKYEARICKYNEFVLKIYQTEAIGLEAIASNKPYHNEEFSLKSITEVTSHTDCEFHIGIYAL